MAQIGIKLADGSFYALLDEDGAARKRVVLTPAGVDQRIARIELLRKDGVETHQLGHLTLEDVHGSSADLQLVVGLDAEGNLDASVDDPSSGEYQSLVVNVHRLDDIETVSLEDAEDDIGLPDFDDDVPQQGSADSGLSVVDDLPAPDFEDEIDAEPNIHADLAGLEPEAPYRSDINEEIFQADADDEIFQEGDQPRPFRPIVLGALLLIGLGIAAAAAFGVYLWLSDQWSSLRAAMFLPMTVGRFGLRRRGR